MRCFGSFSGDLRRTQDRGTPNRFQLFQERRMVEANNISTSRDFTWRSSWLMRLQGARWNNGDHEFCGQPYPNLCIVSSTCSAHSAFYANRVVGPRISLTNATLRYISSPTRLSLRWSRHMRLPYTPTSRYRILPPLSFCHRSASIPSD